MNTLTIRIPENISRDLKILSKAENKSVSDIARNSLRQYIAVEKFRALRKKSLPFAESQGLLTDDDVFQALQK